MPVQTLLASTAVLLLASFVAGAVGELLGNADRYVGAVFGAWAMWLWSWRKQP